jgi:uncharacterized membrane protein (UPF0182 family)
LEQRLDYTLYYLLGAGRAPAPPGPSGPAPSDEEPPAAATGLAAEARRHYDAAIEAQRAGDWARYGEEIRKLGEVIERMSPKP